MVKTGEMKEAGLLQKLIVRVGKLECMVLAGARLDYVYAERSRNHGVGPGVLRKALVCTDFVSLRLQLCL